MVTCRVFDAGIICEFSKFSRLKCTYSAFTKNRAIFSDFKSSIDYYPDLSRFVCSCFTKKKTWSTRIRNSFLDILVVLLVFLWWIGTQDSYFVDRVVKIMAGGCVAVINRKSSRQFILLLHSSLIAVFFSSPKFFIVCLYFLSYYPFFSIRGQSQKSAMNEYLFSIWKNLTSYNYLSQVSN